MAKAQKPAAKTKDAPSKLAKAQAKLISNAGGKTLAQQQREKAHLKQAKLESRVQSAYDKEYSRIQIAMAKQVAREDALRDAKKKGNARK